jgi:hypothetical protein
MVARTDRPRSASRCGTNTKGAVRIPRALASNETAFFRSHKGVGRAGPNPGSAGGAQPRGTGVRIRQVATRPRLSHNHLPVWMIERLSLVSRGAGRTGNRFGSGRKWSRARRGGPQRASRQARPPWRSAALLCSESLELPLHLGNALFGSSRCVVDLAAQRVELGAWGSRPLASHLKAQRVQSCSSHADSRPTLPAD